MQYPGGIMMFHPQKQCLPYKCKPKTGTRKTFREGNASVNCGNPSLPRDPLFSRGLSRPSPGGHLSTPPARRVGLRCPFFHRRRQGLLCGTAVARSRAVGGRVAVGRAGVPRGMQNRKCLEAPKRNGDDDDYRSVI